MRLLAIDTSTDHLTLAVLDKGKVIGRFHKKVDRNHSMLLVPMIERLLKKTRLKPKDIDVFCIGVGPGSFTGLRIGVSTVKGFAYSLNKPIVTVPTMDAIAENAKGFCGVVVPVIDAKKGKVYASIYRSTSRGLKRLSKYLLVPAAELLETLKKYDKIYFLGDGVRFLTDPVEDPKDWHPKAEAVGMLAMEKIAKKRFVSAEELEPMYIYSRECDIKGV